MNLQESIESFRLHESRRLGSEDRDIRSVAVDAIQEFLIDRCGYLELAEIRPADCVEFLFGYYPSQEEPSEAVWTALLETWLAWADWMHLQDQRVMDQVMVWEKKLRQDVTRMARATESLREWLDERRLILQQEIEEQEGQDTDGPLTEESISSITSGLDRVLDLDQLDYARAEEEYFSVLEVGSGFLVLQSEERKALGEPPMKPVQVTEKAASHLRPGDLIHLEVAPQSEGWGVVELFQIIPGGYE